MALVSVPVVAWLVRDGGPGHGRGVPGRNCSLIRCTAPDRPEPARSALAAARLKVLAVWGRRYRHWRKI